MFVPKSVIETLTIDSHPGEQVLDGRRLIAARPEDLHRLLEDLISIKLFMSRHQTLVELRVKTISFWNAQSRIEHSRNYRTDPPSGPLGTGKGCDPLERLEIFNKVGLILLAEIQFPEVIVMIDDVQQSRKPSIVIEAAFHVGEESAQRRRSIAVIRGTT